MPEQPTTAFAPPPSNQPNQPGNPNPPYGSGAPATPYGGAYQQPAQQPPQQYGPGGYGEQPTTAYPPVSQPGYGSQPSYGQSSYGQPSYGQPAYGQPTYGQPTYGQPAYGSGYEQPGYGQGYGPPAPPAKRSKKGLWVSLAALVVIVGALALVSVLASVPSSWYPRELSHTAVEKYIEGHVNNAKDVSCNGGKNFKLKDDGDTFSCTAAGGQTFTVTIKDAGNAKYVVQ